MPFEAPQSFRLYEILEALGRGRMGQAFARLERAVLGAETGRALLQEELAEDVPPGLRQALGRNHGS